MASQCSLESTYGAGSQGGGAGVAVEPRHTELLKGAIIDPPFCKTFDIPIGKGCGTDLNKKS